MQRARDLSIPDDLPLIIGVGQAMEAVPHDLREASSYVDLATGAVARALADTGSASVAGAIDTVAAVRTFEDSLPGSERAFGGPRNLPGAVAGRSRLSPERVVYEKLGGQSPQRLVNEFASRCHHGECEVALLFGVEVIANIRAARRAGVEPDWREDADDRFLDRGRDTDALALIGQEAFRHGLTAPVQLYALMETARRAELGLDRATYARAMGELFAPLSRVAAGNPYAQFPRAFSATELIRPGPENPLLVSPYPRNLVAKDGVNQAAAVLVTSVGQARKLGVPRERWLFLHACADTDELPLLDRPRLGHSLAAQQALRGALTAAGIEAADIGCFDLYSCFPVAVFVAREALGISPDDPRPLTITGGLPYFGGPGNNYSMHAIAQMAAELRTRPGQLGLVYANGGLLSKHSVGIYGSAPPTDWRPSDCATLQEAVDAQERVVVTDTPTGDGSIESWIVSYRDGAPQTVAIVGRQQSDRARFVAVGPPGDASALAAFSEGDPLGSVVSVVPTAKGNLFRLA